MSNGFCAVHKPLVRFELSQVAVLTAVAEAGSFSMAAKRLKLSPSAVGRCIDQLELELQASLFVRARTGITLTPAGSSFLPAAKRLLCAHRELISGMDLWRDTSSARLDVLASVGVAAVVLPSLLAELQKEFGQATMRVLEGSNDEVVRSVQDGNTLLGICPDISASPLFRSMPVLEAQFGLLAPPGFSLSAPLHSLRDLDDLPFVRCRDEAPVCQVLRANNVDFPAYFGSSVVVENIQLAVELVRSGGLITVSTGLAASQSKALGLTFIPLPNLLPMNRLCIVSRRDTVFDDRQERLRDILRRSIHNAPWHSSLLRLNVEKSDLDAAQEPHSHAEVVSISASRSQSLEQGSAQSSNRARILPKEVSLSQARAFLTVAQCHSMTQAAAILHLTQSGVSRVIHELEAALSLILFDRKLKGMALTEAGRVFLPHARHLVACHLDACQVLRNESHARVKLAVSDVMLPYVLPDLLTQSESLSKHDLLQVAEMDSHKVVDSVSSGEAQLGLCFTPTALESVECSLLMTTPIGLLVQRDMELPQTVHSLEEFAHLRWARWADDFVLPQALHAHGVRFDAFDSSPFMTDSMQTAYSAVAHGRLVTLVPGISAHFAIQTGYAVKFLPLAHLLPSLNVSLVGRQGSSWQTEHAMWIDTIRGSMAAVAWPE